jgi:hypothetical protein
LPPGYEKLEAIDALDDCFKSHDEAYERCAELHRGGITGIEACKNRADEILLAEMRALPEDPDEWGGNPKTNIEKEAAKIYRSLAISVFSGRVAMYYIKNTLSGKTIPLSNSIMIYHKESTLYDQP